MRKSRVALIFQGHSSSFSSSLINVLPPFKNIFMSYFFVLLTLRYPDFHHFSTYVSKVDVENHNHSFFTGLDQ